MSVFDDFAEEATDAPVEAKKEKKEKKTVAKRVETPLTKPRQEDLEDGESYDMQLLEEIVSGFKPLSQLDYPFKHAKIMEVVFGDKGTGKTILSFAHPGNILALGYETENNLTLPHETFYDEDPRIQIKPFEQFIRESEGEIKKSSSNLVYEATLNILDKAKKLDQKFDWIFFDGLQRLVKICEMRMRLMHSFGAYEGFKELTIWNERVDFLNELVREAMRAANYGVIFTSQNVFSEAMFGSEKGQKKEPAWKGKIRDDATTVIYTNKVEREVAGEKLKYFYANVDSCKLSGYSGEKEVTFDGEHSPADIIKTIFTTKPKHKFKYDY